MTKELSPVQQKAVSLKGVLMSDNTRDQLAQAVPKWLSADRLLRVVLSSAMRNPKLLECTQESILQSVMMCAQLGLEPIMGRGYLVPYQNSKNVNGRWIKVLECQFQPGYQGLVDLARRSGVIADVWAHVIFENDRYEIRYGTDKVIEHSPLINGNRGKPIGAYAVWKLKDGSIHPDFLSADEIYKRRDISQAYQYAVSKGGKTLKETPWVKWEETMMCKTVIKFSSKMVPASIEFQEAIMVDDAAEKGTTYVSPFMEQLEAPPEPTAADMAEIFDNHVEEALGGDEDRLVAFDMWAGEQAHRRGETLIVFKSQVVERDDMKNCLLAFEGYQKKKQERQKPSQTPSHSGAGQKTDSSVKSQDEIRREQKGNSAEFDQTELDEAHPFFRSNWIRLRGPGMKKYVVENQEMIPDMTMDLYNELAGKWSDLYKESFPFSPEGDLIEVPGDPNRDQKLTESDQQGTESMDQGLENNDNQGFDGGLMDTPEGQKLSECASRYPAAFARTVAGRSPESVDQIKQWIDEIMDYVSFTGEGQGKF